MDFRQIVFRDAAVPAAGAEWSLTVPDGEIWRIVSVSNFLQASAVAANREVQLTVDQGGAVNTALIPSGVTHLLLEGRVYSFMRGAGYRGAGAQSLHVVTSIGDGLYVTGGGRVRSQTQNIQAGDQWSVARLWIERTFA